MKKMTKMLSLLLAFLLVINMTVPAFAAVGAVVNVTVSTDQQTYEVGDTVYVSFVQDVALTDIAGYEILVYYDADALEWNESASVNGTGSSTAAFVAETENSGATRIKLADVDINGGLDISSGEVTKMAFTAKKAGAVTFTFSVEAMDANYDMFDQITHTETAAVTINEPQAPTYAVTLGTGAGYTITAAEGSASPVEQGGSYSFTVTVDEAYDSTNMKVLANGTELTAVEGVYTIANITEAQNVTVEGVKLISGYIVSASADVTTTVGGAAAVSINVTGNAADSITTYNDYDVILSYDPAKLTYVDGTAADTDAVITADAENGTIRITGHGAAKAYSAAVATLNFTANVSGSSDVTISSAKIDNSGNAVSNDAPEAEVVDAATAVIVNFSVTLPEGFTGDPSVIPGTDYTFTVPNDVDYYDVTIQVGDTEVEPIVEGNQYTIPGVNGDIVITAIPKTYNVTATGNNASVSAPATATYGTDYKFTATTGTGYAITDVTITINGEEIAYTIDSTGAYVIAGKDIKGDITITVSAEVQAVNTTQITFSGVEESEIVGGLIQFAPNGQDFAVTLNLEDGYTYTVMAGDTELTVGQDGVFTIPGTMLNGTALTIAITKTPSEMIVEVSEYITLNEKTMFLVTAKFGSEALTYGEEGIMFWSDVYAANCWLVVSAEGADAVQAAAEAAVKVTDAVAAEIAYDCDVNQTTVVDINDAQLTYDMYNGTYDNFETVTMDKFLEADLNGDGKVYTEDVAAIVNKILNG